MVSRDLHTAARSSSNAEAWLDAAIDPIGDSGRPHTARGRYVQHARQPTPDALLDGEPLAAVGIYDEAIPLQALPHRRPRGEYDQVALVEARGEAVEVFEACLDARYLALLLVEALLSRVERLAHVLGLPESILCDAAADIYNRPQERLAAHDVSVPARVRSRRDALDNLEDVGPAAYPLELVDTPQFVRERQLVYGFAARVKTHHGPVDDPMHLGVEVLGGKPLRNNRHSRLRNQHRTNDSPLRIKVVRRYSGRLSPGLYTAHPPPAFHNLPACSKKAPVTRREP